MVLFTAFDAGLIGLCALIKSYGITTYESRLLAVLFGSLLASALFFMFVPLPKVSGDIFWRRLMRKFVLARLDNIREHKGNVFVLNSFNVVICADIDTALDNFSRTGV